MAEKIFKSRIVHKHDTAANWSKATTFIPKQGEIIIYDDEGRMKIGDGKTLISALPFSDKAVRDLIDTKVDKVSGKGLSTNDYTTAEKNKLAGIAEGANKTVVDTALSTTSTNPVQNKVVKAAIDDVLSNKLGGKTVSEAIADAVKEIDADLAGKVDKVDNKQLSTNDYTTAEKNKLSGIAAGAEVNQNTFSNITVGSTTIAADAKTDTLTLVAGSNVTITPDATNDKITIAATDTKYTHPTHTSAAEGLYKVTVDGLGHVTKTTKVTKSDITGLGIPAQDTTYTVNTTGSGNAITEISQSGSAITATKGTTFATKSELDGLQSDVVDSIDAVAKDLDEHAHDDKYYGKTAGEGLANTLAAVKEDVDAFFKDATISTAAKDTLKEIQEYIESDVSAAAEMTASINNKANASDLTAHTTSKSNPHSVTKSQVGLGNVPNVATNDQTPTYTVASTAAELTSGEKLSVAFGKIAKAVKDFISHIENKSNPHAVTYTQVGADKSGAASAAEANAKAYTDTEIAELSANVADTVDSINDTVAQKAQVQLIRWGSGD